MTKTKTNPNLVCHFLMMFHLLSADRKKGSYLILTILLFSIVIDTYTIISKEKPQILNFVQGSQGEDLITRSSKLIGWLVNLCKQK
jgi:hypothetical protein